MVWGAGGGGSSGGRRYGGGGGGGESLRLSILCIVLIVYEWAAVLFPPPVSVWLLGLSLSLNYLCEGGDERHATKVPIYHIETD